MQRTDVKSGNFHWANLPRAAVAIALLAGCLSVRSMAQQSGQKTFSSPEDASTALITAVQANDEKAMLDILGPDGKQIVSSGDDTEDATAAPISCRDIRKCIDWSRNRMEPLRYISARRTGPRRFHS